MNVLEKIKQAVQLTKEKNYEAAEKICREILRDDKDNYAALSCLGLLYLETKCGKLAEKYLEKAVKIKKSPSVIEGLGIIKHGLEKHEEACTYFAEAIKTNNSFSIYNKYISSLISSSCYKKAYECAVECFHKYPFTQEALYNLIMACIHTGRLDEALKYGDQIIVKYPKYGNGWIIHGLLSEMICNDDEYAAKCYKKALRLGEKGSAYINLAINYIRMGKYRQAIRYLKKTIEPNTNVGNTYFIMASVYFKQRKYKKAFKYYSLKEIDNDSKSAVSKLKRLWDGKTYKDETLLLFMDQGRGDCIMFSRYIPFLEKKFKHINLYVTGELKKLFKRAFSHCKNVSFHTSLKRFLPYDKSVAASNLPYYLKMDKGVFPFSEGYFKADKTKIKHYKKTYFNTDKLKIGLCCEAGGIGWREQIHRSMKIELFEPILKLTQVQCYLFQVKSRINSYEKYPNLIKLGSTFRDFDDTAAALMNLDLLITVDTSVAHLAGALGVKTFMFLPYVVDWRWFDSTDKTEWYDSIKIFKQQKPGYWDIEIERILKEISSIYNLSGNIVERKL